MMAEDSQKDGTHVGVVMMILPRESLLFAGGVAKSPCHVWEHSKVMINSIQVTKQVRGEAEAGVKSLCS